MVVRGEVLTGDSMAEATLGPGGFAMDASKKPCTGLPAIKNTV